ncbi:MAG: hypothetical protein ABSE83_04490 [Methanobacterium sp.]|jgi:hypothetical protein
MIATSRRLILITFINITIVISIINYAFYLYGTNIIIISTIIEIIAILIPMILSINYLLEWEL